MRRITCHDCGANKRINRSTGTCATCTPSIRVGHLGQRKPLVSIERLA